jgi:surface-adhesin protein E
MCKTIFLLLLAVIARSAAAEWAQVGGNEIGTSYADAATIRKEGAMVKMWDLRDFKAVQARPYGMPYMSQKTQREYDCTGQRARIVELLHYSENMGQGDITHSDAEPGRWESVSPGGASEALWALACRKQ